MSKFLSENTDRQCSFTNVLCLSFICIQLRHIQNVLACEHCNYFFLLPCRFGYLNIITYLIEEQKCSPGCTDNSGATLLHEACR